MSVRAIKPTWVFACDFCHKEEVREINRIPEQWEHIDFGSPAYQATRMLACWSCASKAIRAIKSCVQAKEPSP